MWNTCVSALVLTPQRTSFSFDSVKFLGTQCKTICHGHRERKQHEAPQSVISSAFVLRLMGFCNYSLVFISRKTKMIRETPRRWSSSRHQHRRQQKWKPFLSGAQNFLHSAKKSSEKQKAASKYGQTNISTVRNYAEQQQAAKYIKNFQPRHKHVKERSREPVNNFRLS